jgi:hypothetical protein
VVGVVEGVWGATLHLSLFHGFGVVWRMLEVGSFFSSFNVNSGGYFSCFSIASWHTYTSW